MNFLAHIYLSGDDENIRFGNFIGDYVKGRDYNKFQDAIKSGILLHRKIDHFTDSHPIVRQHKILFYNRFHKYAGIITDILYDHFLAHEWNKFSEINFDDYLANTYDWLKSNMAVMPAELKKIVPNIIHNNWFGTYRTVEGLEAVLIGMSKGTSLPPEYKFAIFIIQKHYNELKHDFFRYFPELIDYVRNEIEAGKAKPV
jgi:acyl carrier protein phosphodiesterase